MAGLIDDEVLNTFAVVGPIDDIAASCTSGSAASSTGSTSTAPYPMNRTLG